MYFSTMDFQILTIYTFQPHAKFSGLEGILVGYFEVIHMSGDCNMDAINILVGKTRVVGIHLKPNGL